MDDLKINDVDGEAIARHFHDTYERLAPSFGYETRPDTKAFDPTSANGRLMIAVCSEIAATWNHRPAATTLEALSAENARLREALVQHNDRLRSAVQIAYRDGKNTNWLSFRGQCQFTLGEYHDLVNDARALTGSQSHD